MKLRLFLLLMIVLMCLFVASCEKTVNADTPANAAWLMKLAMDDGNYEKFNALFSEERKNTMLEADFAELKRLTTSGSDYRQYELITFENGEMLLVRLCRENNEYKIENVVKVPEGMQALFQ